MNAIAKHFYKPTVAVIKIRGNINAILVSQIQRQLLLVNKNTVKALAIVVNSQSGCPYETHLLATKVRLFAEEVHVPIYTFAEDKAISTGYQLLSIGSKVYAQSTSIIGQSGVVTTLIRAKQLFIDYGIKPINLTSNKNVSSYYEDNFGQHDDNASRIINKQLGDQNQLIINEVKLNRKDIKVSETELKDCLYNGRQALDKGLVDAIGTYGVVNLKELVQDTQLIIPTGQNGIFIKGIKIIITFREFSFRAQTNLIKYLQLNSIKGGFLILIAILMLKFLIKWTLIVTLWRKARKQRKQLKEK